MQNGPVGSLIKKKGGSLLGKRDLRRGIKERNRESKKTLGTLGAGQSIEYIVEEST